MTHTAWVVSLLFVAAACELFGTATVAVNYWRGAELAKSLGHALSEAASHQSDQAARESLKDLGRGDYATARA